MMDVTELDRERQGLRESEERFRSLVALSSDWYWEQDEHHRFTTLQGGRQRRLDRSPLIGKCRWELPGSTPVGCTWEDHRRALESRQPFRDLVYRLSEHGTERYISVSGDPFHGADGAFRGYRGTASDVTERHQSQERLRQGHAMLRMAMRVGRIGAWVIGLPQESVTWAEGGLVIYTMDGKPAATLDEIVERLTPDCRARLHAAMDACLHQGRRFDVDLELRKGMFPAAWMRLVGEADMGESGPRAIQGTLEDVTERKLAGERNRELGARLVATLDTAAECFLTVNRDWCMTYVNQEAERMLQRSRDDLLGRNLWQEFPEAVGSRFEVEYRRAVATQETVEFDEFFKPLGQWLRIKACPSPQGLAIYFRDITDRHSVRNALLDSQQQLHRLFENTIDGVLHTCGHGRIVGANPAACRMLSRSVEALCGLNSAALLAADECRLDQMLEQRSALGRASGQLRLVRGDGSVFDAEVSSTEYVGTDGQRRAFVVFRDISQGRSPSASSAAGTTDSTRPLNPA